MIEQSEDDGNIILECIADANPNDVTVSFSFNADLKPNKGLKRQWYRLTDFYRILFLS